MEGKDVVLLFAVDEWGDSHRSEAAIVKSLLREVAAVRLESAPTHSCLQFSSTLSTPLTISSAWSPHHSDVPTYRDLATEPAIQTVLQDLPDTQRHVVTIEEVEELETWEQRVRSRLLGEKGVKAVVLPTTVLQCCLKLLNCCYPRAVFACIDLSQPANCLVATSYADIATLRVLAALQRTNPAHLHEEKQAEEAKYDRKLTLISYKIADSALLSALRTRLGGLTLNSQPVRLESSLFRPCLGLSASFLDQLQCPFLLSPAFNPRPESPEALEIPEQEEITAFLASLNPAFDTSRDIPSDSDYESRVKAAVFAPFQGVRVLVLSETVIQEVCERVLRLRDYQPDCLVCDVNLDQPERTQCARNSTDFGRINLLRAFDEFKSAASEELDEDMKAAAREGEMEGVERRDTGLEVKEKTAFLPEIPLVATILAQTALPEQAKDKETVQERPPIPPICEETGSSLAEEVKLEGKEPDLEPVAALEAKRSEEVKIEEVPAPQCPVEAERPVVPGLEMQESAALPVQQPPVAALPASQADFHPIPCEFPPSQSFSGTPMSPNPYFELEKTDIEPFPPLPVPFSASDGLLVSQVLETPTDSLVSASNPCLNDRKRLLSELNTRLNRDLVETLVGEMGLCGRIEGKSPAEEAISQAMEELDWVKERFSGLSSRLAQTSQDLRETCAGQREDIGKLTQELGAIQAKEREMQGKLAKQAREMLEKGRLLRQSLEERQKHALELNLQITSLQEPIPKPAKVVISEVSISETGSLKAQIFLRSFHSCTVQAHLYNYFNYSQKFPLALTPGHSSYELGIYHHYPLGPMGLLIENSSSKPLGDYYNFTNDLEKGPDIPFEETFVAQNCGNIREIEEGLSEQGRQTLRTLAVAWKYPKLELLEHFLATVRSRQSEGLAQVCWSLRNSGLLFAGLAF